MIAALALALLVAGPDPAPAGALRAADLALARACAARDAAAFRALLDADAVFGGPSGLARGPDAVLARWAPLLAPGGPSLAWSPDRAGASAAGDLGWTVGRWRSEAAGADGKARVARGEYVTAWRRGRDGAWRALADLALVPPAPGSPASRASAATFASAAGDLEIAVGTFTRARGGAGTWLAVRRRAGAGRPWTTVVESEVPARR